MIGSCRWVIKASNSLAWTVLFRRMGCRTGWIVIKMHVHWHRSMVCAAITMETKSNPIQKFRPRSHLSELTIFQQQHLTILTVTHKQAEWVTSRIINSFQSLAALNHWIFVLVLIQHSAETWCRWLTSFVLIIKLIHSLLYNIHHEMLTMYWLDGATVFPQWHINSTSSPSWIMKTCFRWGPQTKSN